MGKIYAGTSGWAYTSWRPDFYPAKLASAKFLEYYATRLNSVEVNYTFRSAVTKPLLAEWIAATPANFKFAVKAHQSITHIKRLRGVAKLTSQFLASLEPLRRARKLGPVLFQLPPNFKCDLARLGGFLEKLPSGTRFAIEFRHPSWFVDDVYDRLRRARVALCQAESEKLEAPDLATANFRYFRLRKDKYSPRARKAIKRKVMEAARSGDVFAYFKHEDTPSGAFYATELL
ncbi:MAG TPA: DUF72 domain-containing protein [Candidatus Acidoferrales bacterium]|nr:DUF72 domain-containing protein [Candidatus Acidoferrales bacterium]